MSCITNPAEKKRLAYLKDHYVRGGASPMNWRKIKRLKKAKANRAFRKRHKSLDPVCTDEESAPINSTRRLEALRKSQVFQMGTVSLKKFVASRQQKRNDMIGARKLRQAKRRQALALSHGHE